MTRFVSRRVDRRTPSYALWLIGAALMFNAFLNLRLMQTNTYSQSNEIITAGAKTTISRVEQGEELEGERAPAPDDSDADTHDLDWPRSRRNVPDVIHHHDRPESEKSNRADAGAKFAYLEKETERGVDTEMKIIERLSVLATPKLQRHLTGIEEKAQPVHPAGQQPARPQVPHVAPNKKALLEHIGRSLINPMKSPTMLATHVRNMCRARMLTRGKTELLEEWQSRLLFGNWQGLMYDDKYHVVFCVMRKIAINNWQRTFLAFQANKTQHYSREIDHEENGIHWLRDLLQKDIAVSRLNRYRRAMFIRHPAMRLFATYRDLLKKSAQVGVMEASGGRLPEWLADALGVVLKYIGKSLNRLDRPVDLTFGEFIDSIIKQPPYARNGHWQSLTDNCQPCTVNYHYVGLFEDMPQSANVLLRHLRIPPNIRFPERKIFYKQKAPDAQMMYEAYKDVPRSKLARLWKVYQNDFELFNYRVPYLLGKAG